MLHELRRVADAQYDLLDVATAAVPPVPPGPRDPADDARPAATRAAAAVHPALDTRLGAFALAAVLAFLICLGSGAVRAVSGEVLPIWAANGVLLAQALTTRETRRLYVLTGGALGFLGADLTQGDSLYVSSSFVAANIVEVVIALLFAPRVASTAELARPRRCLSFMAGAVVLAPAVSGAVAVSLLHVRFGAHPFASFRDWVVADALGMTIFTPAALVFFSGELRALWRSERRNRTLALLALLAGVTLIVFSQGTWRLTYWALPPVAVLAFEAELAAVFVGVLLLIAIAMAFTLHGQAALWIEPHHESNHARIIALQLFVLAALGMAFPINALQAQRRKLLDLLRESEQRYRALAENADDVVMQLSLNGTVTYVSPRVQSKLGYLPAALMGTGVLGLVHPADRGAVESAIEAVQRDRGEVAIRYRARRANGSHIWVQSLLSPAFTLPHRPFDALAFTMRDINASTLEEQRREAEQIELKRLAYVDGLSGLYNRRHFDIELKRSLFSVDTQDANAGIVLLLVDIDEFKAYNDAYGHQAGDDCLRAVASAIAAAVPQAGIAARYGGEEFAIILGDSDPDDAVEIAERIRCGVELQRIPHAASSRQTVTVSVGVAAARSGADVTVCMLVGAADAALYRAKRLGRNRIASQGWLTAEL